MKAAPFRYVRPLTLRDALSALAADENARVIAGGQTLVPMMAMRLARPSLLVDVARLNELRGIGLENGSIAIGATTRQSELEHSDLIARHLPLMARVLPWIGHPPTRARGTIGGSIVNADPSAELPLVAVMLEATFSYATCEEDEEEVAAEDFFFGPMATALPDGACLTRVRIPVWQDRRVGTGFHEVSARRSDFAFVAAGAQVALEEDGRIGRIAVGVGGVGDCPIRLELGELIGAAPDAQTVRDAAIAATVGIEAMDDLHASSAYRTRVAGVMAARAIHDAIDDARRPASC